MKTDRRRDDQRTRSRLEAARTQTVERLSRLSADYRAVVESSRDSNADDEHDPEGATIAYERSQVGALSEQAERQITEIDAALSRLDAGNYGRCTTCGQAIAAPRLAARPAAEFCLACAM